MTFGQTQIDKLYKEYPHDKWLIKVKNDAKHTLFRTASRAEPGLT
jgi:hypothetical protein